MIPTVWVGIGLGIPEDGDFIVGDATRGVIGSTTYTLGSGYTTITGDTYTISTRRGRWSRLWDDFDSGSASVSVWNYTRNYDPSNIDGPYNGYIVPGRPVRVSVAGVPIWTGYVDDVNLTYDRDGVSVTTFVSTDGLGMLGQTQFDAWTSDRLTADGKLTAICDRPEVGWSTAKREFDPGVEGLQSDSVSWGSNAKSYACLVARSDLGYLFCSVDGTLTYRSRLAASGAVSSCSFGLDDIPFVDLQATIGSELLFARVSVDREGGTAQTATVDDLGVWQEKYGPLRSLSISGLLLASDAQSLALAEYLLKLYDTPRYRVSEIEVQLAGLSSAQQASVLALDISSVVDVTFTPDRIGHPIVQTLVVQGIAHSISADRHSVILSLIDAPLPYFRIGDATYGIIGGEYLIGF